tara:strand:- start:991 stop:1476 length:486 start_codon:yes stop_codon:yes gene_type:complete
MDPLLINSSILFFDYSTSLLFNTERSWVGITVRHLNRPDISMTHAGNVPLEMFMSAHPAVEFPLSGSYGTESSIYVLGNFMQQNAYNRFDFGTQYEYSHFITSINVFAVMKWEGFKMSYSYDFNLSEIGKKGGTYEMSITYEFSENGFGKRGRRLKCPTFF